MSKSLSLCTTALIASLAAWPALAQDTGTAAQASTDDSTFAVEEVVVTAQKRAENVQDVPISVTAFSGEALEEAGVTDIRDLRRITPNLSLTTSAQTTNTRVMIRGIGTAGNTAVEPSVAFFVDGVYIPRVGSLLAGLNDVSSVEVLRGPQGTLFGRNASMGAVLLRTSEATDDYEGEIMGSVGNYGRRRLAGFLNVPVSDTLSGRVAVLAYTNDGFGENDLTGESVGRSDAFSLRGAVNWDITPDLNWSLKGDYQNLSGDGQPTVQVIERTVTPTAAANWRTRLDPDGAGPLVADLDYAGRSFSRNVRYDTQGDLADYQTGLASNLTWDGPGGYQLKLISGYRDWHNDQWQANSGYTAIPLQSRLSTFDSQSHSEELQVLSPELFGRLTFVGGLFYYQEDYDIGQVVDLSPNYCNVFLQNTSTPARVATCRANPLVNAAVLSFDQTTTAYAAYTQGTIGLTDKFDLTAGLRYSKDEKTGGVRAVTLNPTASQAAEVTSLALEEDKFTYRLNATYRPMDDIMLFASYATGFKSGGFDASAGVTAPIGAANRTFNPETTTNIEFGVKSQLFDRRLTANVTAFRTDITEYQFRSYDGVQFRVRNNGEVRQQGVEFDLTARPTRPLTVTLSSAYLDSEYLEFRGAPGLPAFGGTQDLTGTRLPFSPEWQGAASAQYEDDIPNTGMSWLARADLSFTTSQNLSASADNNPDAVQAGYTLLGARLALRGAERAWELALVGQNLADEDFCVGIFNQPQNAAYGLNNPVTGGTVLRCTLGEPRTVSVELTARF